MEIQAIIGIITGIICALGVIIPLTFKIVKNEKLRAQTCRKHPKVPKNAVFNRLDPRPIYKSPKGYICYDDDQKNKPAACGKCYSPDTNLTHLEHVKGGKYVCPVCKTEYRY